MPSTLGSAMRSKADEESPIRHDGAGTERTNLARRYRSIGIPAVAAAARYHIAARNPAYAPAQQPVLQGDAED